MLDFFLLYVIIFFVIFYIRYINSEFDYYVSEEILFLFFVLAVIIPSSKRLLLLSIPSFVLEGVLKKAIGFFRLSCSLIISLTLVDVLRIALLLLHEGSDENIESDKSFAFISFFRSSMPKLYL